MANNDSVKHLSGNLSNHFVLKVNADEKSKMASNMFMKLKFTLVSLPQTP